MAEKARRDAERFEQLRGRPLTALETLALALALAALVAVAAPALIAQR